MNQAMQPLWDALSEYRRLELHCQLLEREHLEQTRAVQVFMSSGSLAGIGPTIDASLAAHARWQAGLNHLATHARNVRRLMNEGQGRAWNYVQEFPPGYRPIERHCRTGLTHRNHTTP